MVVLVFLWPHGPLWATHIDPTDVVLVTIVGINMLVHGGFLCPIRINMFSPSVSDRVYSLDRTNGAFPYTNGIVPSHHK
jgi:hypothetical protein